MKPINLPDNFCWKLQPTQDKRKLERSKINSCYLTKQCPDKITSTQSNFSGPCILILLSEKHLECIIKLKCSHSHGFERYLNCYPWEGGHPPKFMSFGACPPFEGVKFVVFPNVDVFFFYLDWVRIECKT